MRLSWNRVVLFVFSWIWVHSISAQLDSLHWIPPLHTRTEPGPQYLYLSTPSIDSIEIRISSGTGEPIMDCTGTPVTSVFISNQTPRVICFRDVDSTQLLIPRGELHQVLTDRGVMLRSSGLFYANVRVRSNNQLQAGSLTAKGTFGKGKIFRAGHLWSNNDPSGNKCHFVSIMATEDSTTVRFSDYDPGVVFENWLGPLPDIILDRGECYLTSVYLDAAVPANDNGIMGMLIESDRDIVINSGSWDGSPNGNIRDIGIDQITPLQIVGKEYILVRGQGPSTIEYPTIVAHYDNTEIFLAGQAVPYAVIDAGEFAVIPDTEYSSNGNLYIRASKDIYVFQMMGGTGIAQTVGMNFIPPLSCLGQNFVDNIPFIGEIGPWAYTGGLFIVARTNSNVMVNDLPPPVPPSPVPGNPDYETYKIVTGLSGNVKVNSDLPVQVGLFGYNGAAGYGGYYSGFEVVSIDLDLTADPCADSIRSYAINVDSFVWLRNGLVLPDENDPVIQVKEEGLYQVVGLNLGCPDEPDTSRGIRIYLPDSVKLYDQSCFPGDVRDTFLFLKNRHGCDSIVHLLTELLPSSMDTMRAEICQGDVYPFAGIALDSSGIYVDDQTNIFGCDSTTVLMLTVWPVNEQVIEREICQGDSTYFSGQYYRDEGRYTLSMNNRFGCDSIIHFDLKVLPVQYKLVVREICAGDSLEFGGRVFQDSGLFRFDLQNRYGCDSIVDLQLKINPLPAPEIQGVEPYCRGDSILLDGGEFSAYRWSNGSSERTIWASSGGVQELEVTNEFGCTGIALIDIPAPILIQPEIIVEEVRCFGDRNGEIRVPGINGGIEPYQIILDGDVVNGQVQGSLATGTYQLQIVDSIGCRFDTVLLVDGPREPVWLNLGPDLVVEYGEEVQIRVATNANNIQSLVWFAQGSLICDLCFDYRFTATDDTRIMVEVIDERGCPAEDDIFIRVIRDKQWFIPNAFTPNDDGNNDRFTAFGNAFVELIELMEIYSRWGELLYYTKEIPVNDTRYGWDGTFQGKPLNPGVFVYRVVIRYKDGSRESIVGDVTLIR